MGCDYIPGVFSKPVEEADYTIIVASSHAIFPYVNSKVIHILSGWRKPDASGDIWEEEFTHNA